MPVTKVPLPGAPRGMNLALPRQSLDDTEARYLQDVMLHEPGEIRRRGPLEAVSGLVALDEEATGTVATRDPDGTYRLGVLDGDASNGYFEAYSANLSTKVQLTWPQPLPNDPATAKAQAYRIFDAKASLTGGAWIGTTNKYDADSPEQALALWRGGNQATYTTGSISVSRGSAAVTGSGTSWSSTIVPGMFLFSDTDASGHSAFNRTYIGVVSSVNSDTSITLGEVSPYAITAQADYALQSLRGFQLRVVTGRVTTDNGSTTVTGAKTKFLSQTIDTGTWNLYRASDLTWVGEVSSVATEESLTLGANAAIDMSGERYILLRGDGDWGIDTTSVVSKVGFLNAVYQERQWFANLGQDYDKTPRVWFSDTSDPEAVDISSFDGDFIDIGSTTGQIEPIRALMPAFNALLVMKEEETFAIFGSTPADFNTRKLEDDGVLSTMSVQAYGGGVIWAGRKGIHFYDGVQVTNLIDLKLGNYYQNAIRDVDFDRYRMWSAVSRQHYFLFIESVAPSVPVIKNVTSSTPTRMTICINMVTRAITFLTNVDIRGAVQPPATSGQDAWFLVNNSSNAAIITDSGSLFDDQANDTVTCLGNTAGPDFYMESKAFDFGDPTRMKKFKEMIAYYTSLGGALNVDVVLGLGQRSTRLTDTLTESTYVWDDLTTDYANWDAVAGVFATWDAVVGQRMKPFRVKINRQDMLMGFRIYQASGATITGVIIGPYSVAFKPMRDRRLEPRDLVVS